MVTPTRVITPEEADGAKEALEAKATMFAMKIAEIAQLLIIHLKAKERGLSF